MISPAALDDIEEYAEYLTILTKSADPALSERARCELSRVALADLEKVGPKGYIHGWIFVGTPGVGDSVFHPQHGHGRVVHHDEHGHVHVHFESGKRRSFGAAGNGSGKLTRRSEAGNDDFSKHLKAAAAANRRGDHAAAADHYRRAAEATAHPKIKREMLDRADRDAARAGRTAPAEPPAEGHKPGQRRFSPKLADLATQVGSSMPKTRAEWDNMIPNTPVDTAAAEDQVAYLASQFKQAQAKLDKKIAEITASLEGEGREHDYIQRALMDNLEIGMLTNALTARGHDLRQARLRLERARGSGPTFDYPTGQPHPPARPVRTHQPSNRAAPADRHAAQSRNCCPGQRSTRRRRTQPTGRRSGC